MEHVARDDSRRNRVCVRAAVGLEAAGVREAREAALRVGFGGKLDRDVRPHSGPALSVDWDSATEVPR